MGIKKGFSHYGGNPSRLVNKYIGTAYDTVKAVADNLDRLGTIEEALEYFENYLGVLDAKPTFRPNGDVVQEGDFYYNETLELITYITSVTVSTDQSTGATSILVETYDFDIDELSRLATKAEDEANSSALSASNALASESAASASETASALSESNAATSEINSANSASASASSATDSLNSANAAALSESNASIHETNALASELAATDSELNAATSESNAATSASNALTSESNAATSEANALTSETNAAASAAAASQVATETDPDFIVYSGSGFIQPANGENLLIDATGQGTITVQLPFMDGTEQSKLIAIGDYNGSFNSTDYISIYDNSFVTLIENVITPNKILYLKYIDSTVGWKIVGEDKESVYDEYVINVYENPGPVNVLEGERWLLDATFLDSNVNLPNPNTFKDTQSMPISIGDLNNTIDGVNNYIDIFDHDSNLVERLNTAGRYITLQYLGISFGWKIIEDLDNQDFSSRLTTLETDTSSNASAITGLDSRLTAAESNISSNDTDITNLDSRLTTAESNISSNDTDISTLQTDLTNLETEVDLNSRLLIAKSNVTESVPFVDGTGNIVDSGLILTFDATSNELYDIGADGILTMLSDKDNVFSTLEAHVNKTGGLTDELLIWIESSADSGVTWNFVPNSLRRQNFTADGDGIKLLELSIDTAVSNGTKFRIKVARTNASGTMTIEQPQSFVFLDATADGFSRKLVIR